MLRFGGRHALPIIVSQRSFHAFPEARKVQRLRSCSIAVNKPRGRDTATDDFEKKVHLVSTEAHGDIFKNADDHVAVVDLVAVEDVDAGIIPHPSTLPYFSASHATHLPRSAVKNLRRNGDTWSTKGPAGDPMVILLVDPIINHRMYGREEAQVEIMSAYRNALYEFYDLRHDGSTVEEGKGLKTLRVPALSLYTADRFQDSLGKLNQQSLIKGFNRTPEPVKDWFISTPDIRIELYVPGLFFPQFEKAFAEDAWLPLQSVADPGRLTLYRGITPPRTLLDYPGWHGNRPELLAAVDTDGRSIEDARCEDPKLLSKSKDGYRIGLAPNPRSLRE